LIRALRGRKGLIALAVVLGLLLGLFLGFWFLSPGYVERKVKQRLEASLGRRGLMLEHHRLEWNHGTHVRLSEVQVAGAGVKATIDTIDLNLSGHAMLRGEARLTEVVVGRITADIDLDRPLVVPEGSESAGEGGALAAAQVTLGDLDVTVRQGSAVLAQFEGTLDEVARLPAGVSVRLHGAATYAGQRVQVEVEGQASREAQEVRVRPADNSPVFVHEAPGVGRVAAHELRVERTGGELLAGVGRLHVRLGPADAALVTLEADQARAQRTPTGWVLRAQGGTLDIQREKLNEIKDLAKALGASVRSALPRSGLPGLPDTAPKGEGAGATLELAELVVRDGDTALARDLSVVATTTRLRVSGEVAGGEGTALIDLADGRPTRVALDFARIDLAQLPPPLPRPPVLGRLSGDVVFDDPEGIRTLVAWLPRTLPLAAPADFSKGAPPKPPPPPPELMAAAPKPMIIKGNLRLEEGSFTHPALASTPIEGITLEVGGTLDLDLRAGRVTVPEGFIKSGPVVGRVVAKVVGWPDKPVFDVEVQGEPVPCAQAIKQVPLAVLGPYRNVELTGTFAPTLKVHLPWKNPYGFKMESTGIGDEKACVVGHLRTLPEGWPPVEVSGPKDDVDWLTRDFVLVVREGVTPGVVVEVGPGTKDYVPLGELPGHMGGAAYLSEEMGFFVGGGISLPLIGKAIITNLEKRRFAYGGSTVTQQLVKNLFLTRDKTLARKFQEGLVASRIAAVIPKHRTLELYVNCIEFGQDLYGVGRAAQFYFKKEASRLTPLESVFLANIKPAPRNATWYVKKGHSPDFPWWVDRTKEILRRLVDRELIPPEAVAQAAPYILYWPDGVYQGAPDEPGAAAPGSAPEAPEAPVDEDAPDGVWE
jgi:hypothetical protein